MRGRWKRSRREHRRRFKMGLLAAGVVLGYMGGLGSLACHARRHHKRKAHFKDMVAETCVKAARKVKRGE